MPRGLRTRSLVDIGQVIYFANAFNPRNRTPGITRSA